MNELTWWECAWCWGFFILGLLGLGAAAAVPLVRHFWGTKDNGDVPR